MSNNWKNSIADDLCEPSDDPCEQEVHNAHASHIDKIREHKSEMYNCLQAIFKARANLERLRNFCEEDSVLSDYISSYPFMELEKAFNKAANTTIRNYPRTGDKVDIEMLLLAADFIMISDIGLDID